MQSIPQGDHRTWPKERTSLPTNRNEKEYKGMQWTTMPLDNLDEINKFLERQITEDDLRRTENFK